MTLSARRLLSLFSLIALLLALCLPVASFAKDTAILMRVVDGDTLEISVKGRPEKVRLIGIDTPEKYESDKLHRDAARTGQDAATIRALGQHASRFTASLVHPGDTVQLEYDQQPRDKYHRLLAFVWLPDGRMLNETIVCEGYANAYTRFPFKQAYMDRFRNCERHAREQSKGLWGEGLAVPVPAAPRPVHTPAGLIRGNRRSLIYHLPGCPNYNDISPAGVISFGSEQEAVDAGYRKAKNCP